MSVTLCAMCDNPSRVVLARRNLCLTCEDRESEKYQYTDKDRSVTLSEVSDAMVDQICDDVYNNVVPPTLYTLSDPPKPLTNRRKALRFLRNKLWCQPWAAFHRMAPGQCKSDCGDE